MQWVHNACANIKDDEAAILESACDNILLFCTSCIAILPKALDTSKNLTHLEETFDAG